MASKIPIPEKQLAEICRKQHIKRLSFFGSFVRDDFGPDSDIDILVEFAKGMVPGLKFFSIQRELTELFGRQVDLNTPESLSPFYRDNILDEAKVLYVAA